MELLIIAMPPQAMRDELGLVGQIRKNGAGLNEEKLLAEKNCLNRNWHSQGNSCRQYLAIPGWP